MSNNLSKRASYINRTNILISESLMNLRPLTNTVYAPLLKLIERRFGLCLPDQSIEHLRIVREHYLGKRKLLLWEHGEAGVLARKDYAKAVMISEAALLILREIDPWPRRKQAKKGTS